MSSSICAAAEEDEDGSPEDDEDGGGTSGFAGGEAGRSISTSDVEIPGLDPGPREGSRAKT